MLLGFKKQFKEYVREGSKTHTIRAKRKVRPRAGQSCDCYGDVRQKTMHLLGRWRCVRVQDIYIEALGANYLSVKIDGVSLSNDEMNELFYRDGFREKGKSSAVRLARTFWEQRLQPHTFPVSGVTIRRWSGDLIHWDYAQPVEVKHKSKKKELTQQA